MLSKCVIMADCDCYAALNVMYEMDTSMCAM